ncbi:putative LRR receptor-like serine/threonine-protein kinase [Camellia lanceoleosa]|uniref:LRR receptor-like serine/threonine-protein kinase n=1 Tax=Camellia lanceoleosa TaxID=1840588 RepID=A0ACC0GKD0_9ERIC|nr:putative LRR receptor-like serine/threonine-protein kinase [Camellia lanceoleosa]
MDDSQLYTNARLFHLSLTYYGHRLANGQYTVILHFAEIILRNNQSFQSLGRRIFDVFIQGVLLDGIVIAVKQLSSKSKQGNREFVNEIGMISGLQHPNRVRLYGCCIERDQLLLVYEYMEKNNLARALFGNLNSRGMPIGIGLAYHSKNLDIKATNILLDMDLNPKISDFGLAKLDEDENTHISTRIAGTIGYMAPEYALWGHLTHKADVYSFGIVALETIAGKNNMKYRAIENYVCLLDWALAVQKKGNLVKLMDPKLGSNFNKEKAIQIIKVALSCTNPSSVVRPTMSAVVRMLEGDICVKELMMDQSEYGDDLRYKSLRDKYYELQHQNSSEGQTLIDLSETARNGSSSTTFHDLYPISLDSH